MSKTNIKTLTRQISYAFIAAVMVLSYFPNVASAAQVTDRKVVLGSSTPSASTTYEFTFTVPSTTVIKSAGFAACTTASGACTPAPGFSASSSSLTGQPTNLGDAAGWTVSTATAGELRLSKTGNVAAPTPATPTVVSFSGAVNPSAANSTFYMRITTYSDDAWSTPIDTGTVATSTAGQITVNAAVNETLTFTLAAATVELGTLSTSSTGTGTSTMTVATNASNGYSVSYSGATLTSGSDTIAAMSSGASDDGTEQFGINLMNNTLPDVGADKTGSADGVVDPAYDTADTFMFNVSGDIVAAATVPTNDTVYTTSYIANIEGATAAGAYSTVITYTATANF